MLLARYLIVQLGQLNLVYILMILNIYILMILNIYILMIICNKAFVTSMPFVNLKSFVCMKHLILN
jgi:hypothetical protein